MGRTSSGVPDHARRRSSAIMSALVLSPMSSPRSTACPSSALPLSTLANFSLLLSVLTLLCLPTPSLRPGVLGVLGVLSSDELLVVASGDAVTEELDLVAFEGEKKGKVEVDWVLVEGVEGTEADNESDERSCNGSD